MQRRRESDKATRSILFYNPVAEFEQVVLPSVKKRKGVSMKTLLYPPTIDWHYLYQRPQQLFSAIARLGWRTVFCNLDQYIPQSSGIKQLAPRLFLVNHADPYRIPMEEAPLLWITYPPHIKILNQYPHQAVIFDAVDEPSEEFKHWGHSAALMARQSDLIIAASAQIAEYYAQFQRPVHLVPNGVDYDHFAPGGPFPPEPFDLRGIPHPRIGYMGALASWIDWALLQDVIKKHPKYSFIFIGPLLGRIDLPTGPNVFYLGRKAYSALPAYLHRMDLLLIPFRVSSMTRACNPVKLWEYLATGKPIVSTGLPEVSAITGVYIGEDAAGFADRIREALPSSQDNQAAAQRIAIARKNSWNIRAQDIIRLINNI